MDDVVGLAKQTGAGAGGLGTANTVPSYYLPVTAAAPGVNTEEMELAETTGTAFEADSERGVQWFGPTARGACRANSAPRLLSGFLGDPVTTTPGGGTTSRDHEFDPVARPTPRAHSILLARRDPTTPIIDLVKDCIGNEISLDIAPGGDGWMLFDASWVGTSNDDTQPNPSPTVDLSRRFAFHSAKAYLKIGAGSEAEIPVGRFGLRYALNTRTDQAVLGSRQLYKAPPQRRRVELTFMPKEDLSAYYRRALKVEPDNVQLRLVALGPIIEAAIPYRFELKIYRAFEFTAPLDIDGAATLVDTTVTARAALDSTSGKIVSAYITNTVATY